MLADSRWGWPQPLPDKVSSVTRCSTKYAASSPSWVPTDYWTSTSYVYKSRTELWTPKPSTTSVSATSTFTDWQTAPNNLTKTVYTDTYTFTDYRTQYETVSVTATVTKSLFYTATIPTQLGFTPVAATYPEATQHVDEYSDKDLWSVEDAYSQDESEFLQEPEVPDTFQLGNASKVDCLVTIVNSYYQGTTSSKLYVIPPTYTRTTYVATVTTTTTVSTKVAPSDRTTTTWTMASGSPIPSWITETHTNTETVSSNVINIHKPSYMANLTLDYDNRVSKHRNLSLRCLRHRQHRRYIQRLAARQTCRRLVYQELHGHPLRLERKRQCNDLLHQRCRQS